MCDIKLFKKQDFYELRDKLSAAGRLFEDPEFPASDETLFSVHRNNKNYKWLRPKDIHKDPQFFVEGFSRFDVDQGELGDCWLLAAAASLTYNTNLFSKVVCDDNSFTDKYAGIFHFRFWQYGKWVDIVVDDRLPTYFGKLIYMHSTECNEFWSALLEKAYAKLHGSYEALKGGTTCEALEDFTGGVTESFDLKEAPENIFRIISKGFMRQSMMGCSIKPDPNIDEAVTPQGLVCGHAYSLTSAQMVDIATRNKSGKIPLLRLRNPWGNETEWKGAFSDNSREWKCIPELAKDEMGLVMQNDGEFWMTLNDFLTYFDDMDICNLTADGLVEEEGEDAVLKWNTIEGEGAWVKGVSAGGCRNHLQTFVKNPQFVLTLEHPVGDADGKCTVLVALMQKNRRNKQIPFLSIGFALYRLADDFTSQMPFNEKFFNVRTSTARCKNFQNSREVTARFKLPGGKYLIIPSTFEPEEEGEFLLRVFSETPNALEKIK